MNVLCLLLTINILSGITLASSFVSATDDEVVDSVQLTVPIACTMTGTGTTHTAIMNPGTYSGASGSEYENGIGKTTLTAICNDDNGFSIYAIGYTGNSYDSENHTKLVGSSTGGTISTKAYASGDTTSNWSMKLIKVTDTSESYNPQNLAIQSDTEGSFDAWHSVPASYTKVAQYKANTGSSTTDTTLGVKLETTYAAYIASNQPADTYVGQVKYTMVHPYDEQPAQPQTSASGKICYYANASNAEGTMGCQDVASSVTLLASNFSRTGYGFAGWSDKFDYAANNGAHFYGPQENLSIPDTSIYTGEGKGLSLYAVWVKSQGNLQDSSKVASVCNALTTAPTDGTANLTSVSALTDQRDNETYAIAKLADGNCWMIENLRLESTGAHNSDGTLAQGYGTSTTYGNFSGLADAEPAWANNITTANSLYYSGTQDGTASINIGTGNYPGYRFPRYNNTNISARASSPTTSTGAMYSYGNYYTWHAAIADLNLNTIINQSTTGTSLCPNGWHLPTGGGAYASDGTTGVNITGNTSTYREFYNLGYKIMNEVKTAYEDMSNGINSYYGSTTNTVGDTALKAFRKYPNNFVYSGQVHYGSVYERGRSGSYWSSTVYSSSNSYDLNLVSGVVYPGTSRTDNYIGKSIRCLVTLGS